MTEEQIQQKAVTTARAFITDTGSYFKVVVKEIANAIRSTLYPVKELEGSQVLVLYFDDPAEREEFVEAVKRAKPNLVERRL